MNKGTLIKGIIILFFFVSASALENYQAQVTLEFNPQSINITHPINTTYNFSTYLENFLMINASSHFPLINWKYTLRNINKNTIESDSLISEGDYTANKMVKVNRGSNHLVVSGTDINIQTHTQEVYFYVNTPNYAPIIDSIDNEILICENEALSYFFSSYDIEGDDLYVDINPKSPFYIQKFLKVNDTTLISEIYSGILRKERIGKYEETVTVSDGEYADTKKINMTVIEVNNPPSITEIGVQTLWVSGENSTLNKTLEIYDPEDGRENILFNLTASFTNITLFNISEEGNIYFKANSSHLGIHNVTICAEDNGIKNVHPNISICFQNESKIKTCSNFSITVTNTNRPPTITSKNPNNENLTIILTNPISFNISKFDPDGTIPDSYWYLDNKNIGYFKGKTNDSISLTFECGKKEVHTLKAEITDGLENDSVIWKLNVDTVACPLSESLGGGGGGGASCIPRIACEEWSICQNAKNSLGFGLLSEETYRAINKQCEKEGYDSTSCGVKIRICSDLLNCTKIIPSNHTIESCKFTLNPGCSDNIQNCHNNSCETLVDCGGPCSACPTCSDGIQNQNEEGIDCNGPCPKECRKEILEKESTKTFFSRIILTTRIGIIFIILLLLLLIIYIRRRIYLLRKEKRRIAHKYFRGEKIDEN